MEHLTKSTPRQSSHQQFIVGDSADVGAVRRAVGSYADRLCADPAFTGSAAQTATELATNLLRHATAGGWILVRPLPPDGVEILSVDRGPGIRDVAAAVAGLAPAPKGLGLGLAAARNASSYFDIDTHPDRGTVILAVVQAAHASRTRVIRPPRHWAGVSVGIDDACGDGWAVIEEPNALTVTLVDGLGHGVLASIATDAAINTLADHPTDLDGYLARANAAMRNTRGAAVAVCRLEPDHGELQCLSVGNISARVVHGRGQRGSGQHSIVSFNGTVGMREKPPTTRNMRYPWPPDATLVLWTDGLAGYIDLGVHTELLAHDPAVAAAALHRDYGRGRDDASVVVVRNLARS